MMRARWLWLALLLLAAPARAQYINGGGGSSSGGAVASVTGASGVACSPTTGSVSCSLSGNGALTSLAIGGATIGGTTLAVLGGTATIPAVTITKNATSESAIDFYEPDYSGFVMRFYQPGDTPNVTTPSTYIATDGGYYSRAEMTLSGHFTSPNINPPSADALNLGVWADVPDAIQSRPNTTVDLAFSVVNSAGTKHVWAMDSVGTQYWGLGARTALGDVTLGELSSGILAVGTCPGCAGSFGGAVNANGSMEASVFLGGVGSVGAPSLTNSTDATTGFYFPSAGKMGCSAGGTLEADYGITTPGIFTLSNGGNTTRQLEFVPNFGGSLGLGMANGGYLLGIFNAPSGTKTAFDGANIYIGAGGGEYFGNTTDATSTMDTGIDRKSSGIIEVNNGSAGATGAIMALNFQSVGAAATVTTSQVSYGGTTAAATNCGTTPTACIIINVAGTTRYIPYY